MNVIDHQDSVGRLLAAILAGELVALEYLEADRLRDCFALAHKDPTPVLSLLVPGVNDAVELVVGVREAADCPA